MTDAWDECVACGHDREDHTTGTPPCTVTTLHRATGMWAPCDCAGFLEERTP